MRLIPLAALLLSTALVPPSFADEAQEHWRVFVSDSASPKVTAIDVDNGKTLGEFALEAPASLYASSSRQAIFAVEGKANKVEAIRSGLVFEDHGDHSDLKLADPEKLDLSAQGDRPVHFVEHGGQFAIFFDGSGKISVLGEKEWLSGSAEPVAFDSGKPHHGVAVPWQGGVIVSNPVDEEGKLPTGFNVLDGNGAVTQTITDCTDVHGEAMSGHTVAFGCSDGVLIAQGKTPEFNFLSTKTLGEGRVGTLLGGKTMEFFLGNFGPKALAVIEPEAETPIKIVELPETRVHFILDQANSRLAYVLLANGAVHEFDVVTGELKRSAPVTAPYATDGGHGVPMPRLAQAGNVLLISDPAAGKLHKLDLERFAVVGDIATGGAPSSIVAVGGAVSDH